MKFNAMIPELTVTNLEQTKDFYLNQLGFVLECEREADKFIFLSYGESQFMFEQVHDERWSVADLVYPFGRGVNFSIIAPNVSELYQNVQAAHIKRYRPLQEVTYQCEGQDIVEVQFLIQAPDGYLLRFTN